MTTDPGLDLDHLREWIGREDLAEDVVTADLARKYHAMFDGAGPPPGPGDIVPRLIHFCLAQPAAPTAELGADGHAARGGFLPPVPLPRRMWAGGSLVFHGDLKVGDRVRRTSRILDIVLKEGRTGPLCFVTVAHRFDVDGRLAIEDRQDIVFRGLEAPGGPAPKAPPPAEPGTHRRRMEATPPLLFRYSALTFNGHRIHYDRRYATEVEGYPGLIVHGPLQAAWLAAYATDLRGTAPSRFTFRGLSPLFDEDVVTVNATADGDALRLWTAREGGPIAMSAEARWD
ncbi:FAS1-like dehydratase domain-containing protein [Phreatobacter sp.]|uniref:FAS1-like dehydratase domain-containing protein n=1 Tax=Phreatobacter sp. TaxID=1966341 RepID=UPI003F7049CE